MRRPRGTSGRRFGPVLCLANLLCLLPLTIICLLFSGLISSRQYGQFFNVDAGQMMCLQQSPEASASASASEPSTSQLELAPCQTTGLLSGGNQRFRLDAGGQLRSQDELCVGMDLRLAPCRQEEELWVFTQGSGLVHVDSGLCMTRDGKSRVRLGACNNRPQQYWWHQLEGADPP